MIWNKKKDGAENPGAETPAAQTTKAPVLFLQKNWKWIVPVVCVVIAGGVFLLKPKSANTTAVDPSYLEASPEVRDVSNTLSGTGTLNPANTYTVKSLVEGKVLTGEFEEGAMVLRAKIDMASSNMHFRDPIMYRIIKHPHHRTGEKWKVYPMYDFAHGQSDYFEGVTHSICTLEFVPHRPLYEYFVKELADETPPGSGCFPKEFFGETLRAEADKQKEKGCLLYKQKEPDPGGQQLRLSKRQPLVHPIFWPSEVLLCEACPEGAV